MDQSEGPAPDAGERAYTGLVGLARAVLDANERGDAEALRQALAELRAQVAGQREREEEAVTLEALTLAVRSGRDEDVLDALHAAALPALEAALPDDDEEPPAPLLWATGEGGAILSAGELAILSGSGGGGKSTIALDLALAGMVAELRKVRAFEAPSGLTVARGATLIASYEDSAARIRQRVRALTDVAAEGGHVATDRGVQGVGSIPLAAASEDLGETLQLAGAGVRVQPLDAPLWAPEAGQPTTAPVATSALRELLRRAEREQVRLLVIDPASAAFGGNPNDGAAVRGFLAALSGWARAREAGVLIVAHDTKAARRDARQGVEAGADAIAGSAQWHDGARAVLWLAPPRELAADKGADLEQHRERERERRRSLRVLQLEKANYARTGWSVELGERTTADGRYAGWAQPPRDRLREAVT